MVAAECEETSEAAVQRFPPKLSHLQAEEDYPLTQSHKACRKYNHDVVVAIHEYCLVLSSTESVKIGFFAKYVNHHWANNWTSTWRYLL